MSGIFELPIINGEISKRQTISGNISAESSLKGSISRDIPKPYYDGEYEVTPKVTEQTLETADKTMRKDVTVKEIPYSETTNPDGGTTVVIAYEE